MGRLINLVGERFGMLTVVKRDGKNSSNHVTWECVCDCGNTTVATGNNLRGGHSKSCGCLKKINTTTKDLSGAVFGKLTVLNDGHRTKFMGKNKKSHAKEWRCLCDCGNETYVTTGHLTTGHTNSCGCWAIEQSRKRAYKNLAGKKKIAENGTLPKRTDQHGYALVHDRNHTRANKSGFVREHIKVVTERLQRDLLPTENVHHINGVRDDNRIENLELWNKGQPCGQRVNEKQAFYVSFVAEYQGEFLNDCATKDLCGTAMAMISELTKRAGLKDSDSQVQDLQKAVWYINDEIKRLENITNRDKEQSQ